MGGSLIFICCLVFFALGYIAGRTRSAVFAAVLFGSLSPVIAQDTAAAMADRALFPPEVQPHLFYVSTAAALNANERTMQEVALKFVIPHLSRQPVLDRCLPQQVGPTLWRLNLLDYQWAGAAYRKLIAAYPYHPTGYKVPLVVQAHWFLPHVVDPVESSAYYDLLLGGRPKDRAEVFKAFGVTDDVRFQYGQIAGGSPVAKNGVRYIRSLAALRAFAYLTEDMLQLSGENDPLKFPIGAFPHDGEELLVADAKVHLATNTRGVFMRGFLFNGKGVTVDRAPVDLVEDYTKTRGFSEIRAGISCFSCHQTGPNGPSRNVLKDAIESGVDAYAYKYGDNEKIEAFHLGSMLPEIKRDSDDYCSLIRLATGVEPVEAVDAFRASCDCYDADVTLDRMAAELYIDPLNLQLAIGWMNANHTDLGGWIPAAAQNPQHTVPREVFEEYFVTMYAGCEQWRAQ